MRIEVITDILTVKIVDEGDNYSVLFNQGYLVPFLFDGTNFFVETYEQEALKKFVEKNGKVAKDDTEMIKAMDKLPKVKEEIKVVYQKDPTTEPISLALYVNKLI